MKFSIFLIFFICLTIVSCEGPAGPSGNANVKTITFSTTLSNWSADFDEGIAVYKYESSLISERIVNSGFTLVYYKIGDFWFLWGDNSTENNSYYHTLKVNEIYLVAKASPGYVPSIIMESINFKVVVIEGTSAAMQLLKKEDLSDYNTIKNKFDLAD